MPRNPSLLLQQMKHAFDMDNVSDKTILDFGGNRGSILEDGVSTGEIVPENYTCLDIDTGALEFGSEHYPNANWILYNGRYNEMYSYFPYSQKHPKFPFSDNSFDLVFSYSVNTHSSYEDFLFDIEEMFRVVKPGGKICTTLVTDNFMRLIHKKRIKSYGSAIGIEKILNPKTVHYYVNNDKVFGLYDKMPHNIDTLMTIYNFDWLLNELLLKGYNAEIKQPLGEPYQAPLVIQKEEYT